MSNSSVQVIGLKNTYPNINLELQKEKPMIYDFLILNLYTSETENGLKVKRINKTTKKGTSVTYEAFKSEDDIKEYEQFLKGKVKEFSKKWDVNMKVEREE